ncbi:hypothetical protein ACEPPN_015136 [Leptodophora sp. 'Broadleaf-Isolate-01']
MSTSETVKVRCWACPAAGAKLYTGRELIQHFNENHANIVEAAGIECAYCHFFCANFPIWKDHVATKHRDAQF